MNQSTSHSKRRRRTASKNPAAPRSGPRLDRSLIWLQARWPWLRRHLAEPAQVLFVRIQLRLLVWYLAILTTILLMAGILLNVAMQAALLAPISTALAANAAQDSAEWLSTGTSPCASQQFAIVTEPGSSVFAPPYVACYDVDGRLLGANTFPGATPEALTQFTQANLAQAALANESASQTVDGGATAGKILCYALSVRAPDGTILGVMQVGYPVQEYATSLHSLATLLWLIGALTVVCASFGGWFLSYRALEPARVATQRQRAFIADAAHELRTPLALLRADAEALLFHREQFPPDAGELLDDIVTEANHMAHLASNLLTLARLDADVAHLEAEVVDLTAVLARAAHRVSALARQQQVDVTVVPLAPVAVIGDPLLLEQAVLILVENAIKYNRPHGTVDLAVHRHGQWARVEVRDTGIGIAAPQLAHVGERFYRGDATRARRIDGAGLGVSVARSIVAAHQGTLTYASIPQQGTTATLILPRAVPHPPATSVGSHPPSEPRS